MHVATYVYEPANITGKDEYQKRFAVQEFEVIKSALTQIAEEMAIALRRSAYSTNVKTRQDFSCALFDKNIRPISQAFTQPVHLGSFVELLPNSVFDPE